MNKQLVLALILCAAVLSQGNNCPGYFGGDLLQSGKNAIMKGKVGGNPQYVYEAPINFPVPPTGFEIAVTTATIGDYNPLANYGYNYFIEAARKANTNFIQYKLIMNNDDSWTSIQLSYLVSGRADMAIGNFESPINQWVPAPANTYSIVYNVAKPLPNTNYRVAAFISGFSTTDSQFSLTINKKYFDYASKQLSVTFYCSANPAVLTLTITYVIYPQVHPVFEITYDLVPRGQVGSYRISGPVNFQPNKRIQYNEWRVENRNLACQGNECPSTCVLREKCAELGANIWEGKCIFCPFGSVFEYGKCSRKCLKNQLFLVKGCVCLKGFTKQGRECVNLTTFSCGDGQVYSKEEQKCVCQDKYYVYGPGPICQSCPDGSVSTADKLSCFCTAPGSIYNSFKKVCQDRCKQNQIWQDNKCRCVQKCHWWKEACRLCPVDATPTIDQVTCVCANPNAFYNPDTNTCVACAAGQVFNADKTGCVCAAGYTQVGAACVITCKANEALNAATGKCQCVTGFSYNSVGVCAPTCGAGEAWNGQKCVCADGYARYGNCRQCPQGTFTNSIKDRCICADLNQIFVPLNFACASCPANSKPSADLSECVCLPGYARSGNSCILTCGQYELPNESFGRCDCIFGYYKPGAVCQPRCGGNQQWNGTQCICKTGFGIFNGACTICPLDATSNPSRTSCKCLAPNHIFNVNTFRCEACPAYSYNSDDDSKCICNKGYQQNGNVCSPICQLNEQLNTKTNQCQCRYGFLRVGPMCTERCGLNQQWTGEQCICKAGHIRAKGACRPCIDNYPTNPKRSSCLCSNPKYIFNIDKFVCDELPAYSAPNDDFSDFNCFPGYNKNGWNCANPCPAGAFPNAQGQCACEAGLILVNNACKKPSNCPDRSTWDANKLECVCDTPGQHLINKVCSSCGENSVYVATTKQCVCNTGFFRIAGECQICDPRTKYNGVDCVCNLGYYGNRDECFKCHESCSVCSGPEANQCQACSDVSLILQKGFCSKNNPCDPGFFLDEAICTKCSDNCIICDSIFECQTCAIGYQVEKLEIENQKIDVCNEICGDGIKYQAECDDGNTENGDGCSSQCTIETANGWTCQGGSSGQKSKCYKYIPDQSILTNKGAVNLGDRVVQSVRASYLPTCLTQFQCSKCFKSIKANVVDANVPILVTVSFIPFSQYQFLIEYNFQGLIVTSKFKTVIKFNEQFKGCLADDDFHQQLEVEIDPAFLAKIDQDQELTLDQITPSKGQPVVSVPAEAKKILAINKK